MDGSALLGISWLLLIVFVGLSLACFVLLLVTRVVRDSRERRRDLRAEQIRLTIFEMIIGDEERAAAARHRLESATGRRWERIEQRIFTGLPKLKGDSRRDLVALLLAKGAEEHAVALVHSWSRIRRCRGAYRLGLLGLVAHLEELVRLLSDKDFLVRRVAVRALGNLGDPRAVRPLLELGERDKRLSRDLVYALGRLGAGAAQELRIVLAERMHEGESHHLEPAAVVLGLVGDRAAVPVLTEGLGSDNPSFAGSCAEALGRIGSPESVPALTAALLDYRPNVRAAAAHGLGRIGSSVAIDALRDVVDEEEPQVSRQAAHALLELGPAARTMLQSSRSPYAVEALELEQIRATR